MMNFGQAIELLKAGKRVARSGWNGKGMWIALTPCTVITCDKARAGAAAYLAGDLLVGHPRASDRPMVIDPHIDMKTASGSLQTGWLASQADMLAEDWTEVGA